jgi:hypothetical protein
VLAVSARDGQGAVGDAGVLLDMAHLKLAEAIVQRQGLIEGSGFPPARE